LDELRGTGATPTETVLMIVVVLDGGVVPTCAVPSDTSVLADLAVLSPVEPADRDGLLLGSGWTRGWTATWRVNGGKVVCPVRDLASIPAAGCEPLRRFSWRTGQRHRPGLQYMVSTGRHHGFESQAEQRLLLALDFAGDLVDVISQPFRLRFVGAEGWRDHTPDFLVVTRNGGLVVDVRPAGRIGADDRVAFAATAEAALAVGWEYLVVAGWCPHVMSTVDTLSSQRRPLVDRLGVQAELLSSVDAGGVGFGELVAVASLPALARAHALHLLWHRRLRIDLAEPLTDAAVVWSTRSRERR
jgi:hypothetical protein